MLHFRLNTRSGTPPYLQIVQQVKQALQLGMLDVGDKLPTVREVVTVVAINPNTVFKAYRELERDGIVEARAGIGTYIVRRPEGLPAVEQAALAAELMLWIERARRKGMDQESIEALMHATIHERKEKEV